MSSDFGPLDLVTAIYSVLTTVFWRGFPISPDFMHEVPLRRVSLLGISVQTNAHLDLQTRNANEPF